MNAHRIDELIHVYRDGLLHDVLPFWLPRTLDREHGGFLLARDRDGTLLDDDKGMWQQCRFTWMLATLYNTVERRDEWLQAALHGLSFIDRVGFDPKDGRMWFHVTRDGRPIRKRRYAFTEVFASIAFAACAKATGRAEWAERAVQIFDHFLHHVPSPPKFTDTRPAKSIGTPMMMIVTAQTLRGCIGYDADAIIDAAIDEIRRDFVKPDIRCVMEQVAPDGGIIDHFDGRTLNPGHAIEAAWFILHEAMHRGRDARLTELGLQMLDWMWQRGWDSTYGGLLYFVDVYGKPVQEYWHDMKFWWPHNEAIIATLLAHHLTGNDKYAAWHALVHDWSYRHFPDPEYGEWYGYLHRDGRISVPLKGNLWKGPFHMPRMKWYCWQLLERMRADAAAPPTADGRSPTVE